MVVATVNWPDGVSTGLDDAVIAAGVTDGSGWPDGLSSASLLVQLGPGATKMSPVASRPSSPLPAKAADCASPPAPKLASSVPLALYRTTACSKKLPAP